MPTDGIAQKLMVRRSSIVRFGREGTLTYSQETQSRIEGGLLLATLSIYFTGAKTFGES